MSGESVIFANMIDEKGRRMLEVFREKAREGLPAGSRVMLYGSRARGDAREDSDWDIHVIVPGPEKLPLETVFHYMAIFEDVGVDFDEEVRARVYSPAGWAKRSFLPFYKNVMADGVVLFEN